MRTILQLIEKLEDTPKRADRLVLIKAMYENNTKFAKYIDMIYGEHLEKFVSKLPAFDVDPDVPNGLHYSNLERNVDTVYKILYDPTFANNKKREQHLIRILENIAPEEVEVIKAIMASKWKWCTPRFYSEELVKNTSVHA